MRDRIITTKYQTPDLSQSYGKGSRNGTPGHRKPEVKPTSWEVPTYKPRSSHIPVGL